MPGSAFFGDNDSPDYSTPDDLLRKKFPGMVAGTSPAPSNSPFLTMPSPTVPAAAIADVQPPDVGQPSAMANLPWMQKPPQPQRPALTTLTGQMVPGLNKAQKLGVLIKAGLQGAMAGEAASENAVAMSGGRRSGGAGLG